MALALGDRVFLDVSGRSLMSFAPLFGRVVVVDGVPPNAIRVAWENGATGWFGSESFLVHAEDDPDENAFIARRLRFEAPPRDGFVLWSFMVEAARQLLIERSFEPEPVRVRCRRCRYGCVRRGSGSFRCPACGCSSNHGGPAEYGRLRTFQIVPVSMAPL